MTPNEILRPLNLPPIEPRLQNNPRIGMTIFDPLRDRFVALTPEEWVRQNFVSYLQTALGYPRWIIANEMGLKFNGMTRRCDTVIFDRTTRLPLMIVEYKAPTVKITEAVFNQIVRYNSVLRARYLVVSNGLQHYCCEIDYEAHRSRFLPAIPPFDNHSAD